jgi:hypothetical protein
MTLRGLLMAAHQYIVVQLDLLSRLTRQPGPRKKLHGTSKNHLQFLHRRTKMAGGYHVNASSGKIPNPG